MGFTDYIDFFGEMIMALYYHFSWGALLQFVFNQHAEHNYNEKDKSYTHVIAFLIDQICLK